MLRGTEGIHSPIYDSQAEEPVCHCGRCRGEVYSGETMFRWDGKLICVDCFKSIISDWVEEQPVLVAFALNTDMEEV